MLENVRCVIINPSYEPLSVVSARRGLIMVLEGKAVMTEQHPSGVVRSPTKKFPLPTQIRLKEYIKARPAMRVPAQLTRRNLLVRDKNTCQYCGRKKKQLKSNEFMTRDHIIPITHGGKDVWTNVVAACNKCNNKKADYFLDEAKKYFGMEIRSVPRVPTVFEIWSGTELKLPKI